MRAAFTLILAASLGLISATAFSGDFQKGWAAYESLDYASAKAEWQETGACFRSCTLQDDVIQRNKWLPLK